MSNITKQEQEIELLRNQFNALVIEKQGNLNHPAVMFLSARLDKLIVECQKNKESFSLK